MKGANANNEGVIFKHDGNSPENHYIIIQLWLH